MLAPLKTKTLDTFQEIDVDYRWPGKAKHIISLSEASP